MHAIGRAYGRPHNTIHKLLLARGGITPIPRRRSRLALTLTNGAISGGMARKPSIEVLGDIGSIRITKQQHVR